MMASAPRFLLLQARNPDDPVRESERRDFLWATGLPDEAIEAYDLLQGPPPRSLWQRYDGLFVGGSGEYNVSDGSCPHLDATLDFLNDLIAAGKPMFASCFGFQLLAVALGGRVERDISRTEVGTFRIYLTPQGQADELFGRLPPAFDAQLGHKEHVTQFPSERAVPLAYSDLSPYQALRIPGVPIWATQFHPELNRESNLGRLMRYREVYVRTLGPEAFERLVANFRESPEANMLLPWFLDLVFGWRSPRLTSNSRS
ncbi:MAG: type 1 glutamine amidotransferase [Chloroflexi bacterium]|nr:type 1 glutamine amidotransferase [Chloroflexota bacterium]